MKSINRRNFLKHSFASAVAAASSAKPRSQARAAERGAAIRNATSPQGIIDTNVNLFRWPFRALKYGETRALVAKLKKHRVIEAWAGSFEALLAKDIDSVNRRLAAECREHGPGFLIPFGAVNLAWPDWEEDVRRCHEVHKMPGVRIYPGYQPFDLNHTAVEDLVKVTTERGLILQVVFGMEDPRVHHPLISVGPVSFAPLLEIVKNIPEAKVQLLHHSAAVRGDDLSQFMKQPNTSMDISRVEGNGGVARMIGSVQGLPIARVPADRILFGSHAPYFPIETALLKLIESPLDAEQLHAIMQGNARRLLPRA